MDITLRDVLTVTSLGGIIFLGYKYKKLSDKYEDAIDDIANNLDINVDNEIIKEAVDRAVERETAAQVASACNKAVNSVRNDISEEVRKAVNAEKAHLKENTKKEIEKKIAAIDISDAKKEVITKAQNIVADRLEEDTKAIAGTYEASIKKVADMCENMISTAAMQTQKAREPIEVSDVQTIIKLFKEA